MNTAELHQRAHTAPQSLTKKEWEAIHKDAFSVPKKDFEDDDDIVSSSGPQNKQKGKGWW